LILQLIEETAKKLFVFLLMLETNLSAAIEKNILGKKKDLQVFFY